MKRFAYILSLCFGLSIVNCQLSTAQDIQRFAERHIIGTARYVGMGGAMTAVGADPSAVLDNPAGLGLYRRCEIMLSLEENIDKTAQSATPSPNVTQRLRFSLPHVSAIWAWGNPSKQRGMIYNNFMFSYNRLADYNRDVSVAGKNLGMAETIALLTNGLYEADFEEDAWNNMNIGWLSILGYEGYLIDPKEDAQWVPAVSWVDGSLDVSETGSADQYTVSWASNISNQWYVGVNLNVPTMAYTKRMTLRQTDRTNSAKLASMFHVSGVGVSGSIGVIYRPLQALRVGASLQTPTVMNLSMQTEGDLYSTINGNKYEVLTPASGAVSMKMTSPLRTSVSLAGQWGTRGMLAVQYDYAHASDMEDVHTLRLGLEAQVSRGVFCNAGYVYESSFLAEDPIVGLDVTSIRTDVDYRYTAMSQYASAGIGYRSDVVLAQVAYQYRWQMIHQYASECQLTPMDVYAHTHRIVATVAWRF